MCAHARQGPTSPLQDRCHLTFHLPSIQIVKFCLCRVPAADQLYKGLVFTNILQVPPGSDFFGVLSIFSGIEATMSVIMAVNVYSVPLFLSATCSLIENAFIFKASFIGTLRLTHEFHS